MRALIYIHGKGGNAAEAAHYAPLFPDWSVIGLDYSAQTPWEAAVEFGDFFDRIAGQYSTVAVIANSIGAYFAMHALNRRQIDKAFFISPIVDMETLIGTMLQWAGVTEAELMEHGTINTAFGETLTWNYLSWVREHPIVWQIPTSILYGSRDELQPIDAVRKFAATIGADLTVMNGGEHWFHTALQMDFLDNWIRM